MSSIQTVASITVKQQAEHNTYPITAITASVKTRDEDEHVIAIPSYGLFLLSDRKSTNLKSDQNEEVLRTVDSKTGGKSKKILIVDDEPDITITFKKALTDKGFEQVDTVNDALLALKNFKAGSYDLLIIDIVMPEMDGFEFYEGIRKIDNKVKVCFLTAFEVNYQALRAVFPATTTTT
jgi:CheY-like chemotaxis protein